MPFLVIFRPHGELSLNTQYVGPFDSHDEAMDALGQMPALGLCPDDCKPGVKHIAVLDPCLRLMRLAGLNGYTVREQWSAADDALEFVAYSPDGLRVGGPYTRPPVAWEAAADHYMTSTQMPHGDAR